MSSSVNKSSTTQSIFNGQNVVYAGIAWAVISLLFFLLFGIGEETPLWYLIGTYLLECPPFLAAAILCFRNWRSPQIASGRNVWLGIALGTVSFFVANLLFGWWELYFGLDPAVSPADLFYIATYLFLGWGMFLAVLPRRLNLETWQWVSVFVIAVVGLLLAGWIAFAPPKVSNVSSFFASLNANQRSEPTQLAVISPQEPTTATALLVQEVSSPVTVTSITAQSTPSAPEAEPSSPNRPPGWATSLDKALTPLSEYVNFFYIAADVCLLVIASTLLLAFWGGRFSQSWRMIAAATFCLYIADMWTFVEALAIDYESGGLLDIFYVFSGVLFAVGAALEYDVSSRSRRGSRRRA
ncbi:hypothetical protein [Lyngbya aestuarii]|uniref:hypothetical protein n=1 Tax=Lyngbya aestuarii TaxID=118322 RepID=UPI00403DEE69